MLPIHPIKFLLHDYFGTYATQQANLLHAQKQNDQTG